MPFSHQREAKEEEEKKEQKEDEGKEEQKEEQRESAANVLLAKLEADDQSKESVATLFLKQQELYENRIRELKDKFHQKREQERAEEQKQRAALLREVVEKKVAEVKRQLQEELQQKEAQNKLTMDASLSKEFAQLGRELEQKHAERLDLLSTLNAKIEAYNNLVQSESTSFSRSSLEVHNMSLALLALSEAFEQHREPFQTQLEAFREAAKGLPLAEAALASIPPHLPEEGVYSSDLLKKRFRRVAKHARRAALVPEDGGMWWHAFSVFLSAGPISEQHTTAKAVENVLQRAQEHIENNDLLSAVRELEEGLPKEGLPRDMTKDWVDRARERIVVDQALALMNAEMISRTSALV
ncbi:hypothetical protein QOT17_008143 [Balamuthia mandrillaris]